VSVTPSSDAPDPDVAALVDLVREYDKCWCELDFLGVSQLWERDSPQPIYLGEEYALPLIGADELDRHWARVGARIREASVHSDIRVCEPVGEHRGEHTVRCVLLSRWRLTARGSDAEAAGNSWITWLVIRRAQQYRIFHHMESQVYFADDIDDGFS
jgi:hypothetical protein